MVTLLAATKGSRINLGSRAKHGEQEGNQMLQRLTPLAALLSIANPSGAFRMLAPQARISQERPGTQPQASARRHSRTEPMSMVATRDLTEENVIEVLNECMIDLCTVFGSNAESREVGITGEVEFVDLDGPIVVVRLKGRFWHERSRVVDRVSSYLLERIPELIDVEIEDAQQLDDADPTSLEKMLDSKFSDEPPVQFGNNE